MAADARCVLLLRGINVGGRHALPMAALRTLLADELGCADVRTYIQSGNVVCTAPAPGALVKHAAAALQQRWGFPVPVVARTADEWRALIAANPFLREGADPTHLHAVFFASHVPAATLQHAEKSRAGEEQIAVSGRELYLFLPHGVGRSKLALALAAQKRLDTPTMRNWRTVQALAAML